MKKLCFVIIIMAFNLCNSVHATEYDVKNVYIKQDLPQGTKIINPYGQVEEAQTILIPIKLDSGNYQVRLTKVASNIYKIDGTDYYIETRFCLELAYYEEVILIIDNGYFNKGKVIFK